MKAIVYKIIVILLLVSCAVSCKRDRCNTPIGAATCQIEPDSPLYNRLNSVGGYEYLVGGNKGLVVVRTAINEFVCYERTCPYDHEGRVEAEEGWGGTVMTCPKCGSQFNTYSEGCPLEGSLTGCPLYEYGTRYEGGILYIY